MNKTSHFATVLESLEPKIAPAGVVTILYNAGTNSLTITGSAGNDDFIMTHTGIDTWAFSSTNNDTQFVLNGDAAVTSINNLSLTLTTKINLGDGDDKLNLAAAAAPGANLVILEGLFEVLGGKGADDVRIQQELNPVFNGLTKFDLGDGYDNFQIAGSATFANKTIITAGAGGADIVLAPFGTKSFTKGLTVDLGSGGGRLFTDAMDVSGGKFEIKSTGGASSQIFIEGDLRVDQGMSISLGSTANTVFLGTTFAYPDIVVGGPLSIIGAGGADSVNVVGALKVSGALTVDMKDGVNDFNIAASSTIQAASVLLKGGKSGVDVNFANNAALATSTFFTVDAKADTLAHNTFTFADGNALKIGTTFTYLGGTSNDLLDFGTNADVDVRGSMIVNLGAGVNGVDLGDGELSVGGNLTLTGLTGVDNIGGDSVDINILGSFLVNLGAGDNGLVLTTGNVQVAGSLSYTSGAGNDTVSMGVGFFDLGHSLIMAAGDGSNTLQLYASVTNLSHISYTGGKGSDAVYLGTNVSGDQSSPYISGSITAKLGAGLNLFTLVDSTVRGAVNVQSTSGATEIDSLTLRDVFLYGSFTGSMGKGASALTLDDSTFNAAVNVTTGDGADVLKFDTMIPGPSAPYTDSNRWNSSVKILSGTGDDQFIFGTGNGVPAATNTNVFRNFNSIFDSGTGTDTVQQNGGQTLSGNAYNVTVS